MAKKSGSLTPERFVRTQGGIEGTPRSRWLARGFLVLLGLPKTLYFNLRCLPFRQALRLPVLVSHRVALFDLSGTVKIHGPARPGTVLLGFGMVGAFDYRRSRSVWQVAGEVVFEGPARLGNGFKVSIANTGRVTFGPEFVLSAESQVVCREAITFGRGCLISWDVLILDSDFHPVAAAGEAPPRTEAPVVLGERVWVGARASILKGVRLANDVVIAAGAVVTQTQDESNVIVGGNPAQVVRTGVEWRHS